MSNRSFTRSFGGGELTPEFYGHIDDAKFQTGLGLCRNFIVLPHGPVANRPGTAFVRAVKDSTKRTRVISFSYSTSQTFVLELGAGYFRFHTQGATLLAGSPAAYNGATAYTVGSLVSSGGINYYCILATTGNAPPNATYWYAMPTNGVYEIPNPYAEADLFDIHFVQSADVLTLVHPNYAPMELRRYGATNWQLATIVFASTLTAPTGVTATNTGAGATTYSYKVTAVGSTGLEEGLTSSAATCTNNLLTTGNYNTINWSAVSGAQRYNVYKQSNGLYGYIGQTDALTFKDDNITADIGKTPPIASTPFTGAGNYPGAVSYYEQRRDFAGTINMPQNFWATRSGTESNLSYSIPSKDDDGISFRIAAREANTIRHIVPLTNLILLTSSAEWRVTSQNSDAITPTSISVSPQSAIGSSNVQPVVVNNNLVFVAARGGHMRELGYSWQSSAYITSDISLRAPHLFDNYDIVDMAFAKAPQPIVWATSTTGKLIGLTYVPEQQIGAFHQHDTGAADGTDGVFESVTVVAEGAYDAVYVVVRRTVNGSQVRYIERFAPRLFSTLAASFFVDAGSTYNTGSPVSTISGVTWLEGKTINILADGAVHRPLTVTGGSFTLDYPATVVNFGLPIQADIETLPIALQVEAYAQGRQKNVSQVYFRVVNSSGINVGPSFDKLVSPKQRTDEPYGTPPRVVTGEIPVRIPASWNANGTICARQSDPLPLTITSLTVEVALGA